MKRYFAVSIILLLCNVSISSAQNDSVVKVSRVKYQQFRNHKESYEQIKLDLSGEQADNTHATAYYDKNDLKIIEVITLSTAGHHQVEYYFENGNLYFALESNQAADEVIVINKKGKENRPNDVPVENRYYFYNDKLIKWYDNERKEMDVTSQSNSMKGESLITEAYKMKDRLKK
jgi:hypothetical protein